MRWFTLVTVVLVNGGRYPDPDLAQPKPNNWINEGATKEDQQPVHRESQHIMYIFTRVLPR